MAKSASPPCPPAISGCLDVCARFKAVVDCLSDEAFAAEFSGNGAPGKHLRHALEHFTALLGGLETGVVDYDARSRDAELENDSTAFCHALDDLSAALEALSGENLGRRLVVRQMAASDCPPIEMFSNLERELVFLSGHAIHHLAVLEQWCQGRDIHIPENISLAFSTAAYRAKQTC